MIISPSQVDITPALINRFETNTQVLIQDSWARRAASLSWDKIMGTRESKTHREAFFWLLETARIVDEGFGGNKRFDDIAAQFFEVVNRNSGVGLRLMANEMRDNQMQSASLRGMPAWDFAASWARQVGANAAYWPQQALITLLTGGTTTNGYDGVPFFSTAHPINGFNASSGTYSNRISGSPLSVTSSGVFDVPKMVFNLSTALAAAAAAKQPNGLPRSINYKYAVAGPDMRLPLALLLQTKTYGGATGVNENIVATWGIEPIILPELTETGVVYLVAEALPEEGGAFVFSERDPYVLSSFAMESEAALMRRKEFEWSYDGRNAAFYGHPYLALRIEAS